MNFREATVQDIRQIQLVRNSVHENKLSDPALVTDEDCKLYITARGKGWVCEINSVIVGFAIVDLQGNNIWALFLKPEHERKGIGKRLHDMMLDWYFNETNTKLWLGTEPNTRAEKFYRRAGWKANGLRGNGEIKFEMTQADWTNIARCESL